MKVFLPLILFLFSSCGVQHRFANSEAVKNDTSFIYALPYPKEASHLLIQGYNSRFSHRGRLGLDFKMKKGTLVSAARSGVVTSVVEDATEGGTKRKYLHKGNYVIVRHSDGSNAYYGHLGHNGVLVNEGDSVHVGQLIAKSGSTGYSAFPHLHFIVWGRTPSGRMSLPTRFYTNKSVRYLRPGRWYKAI